MPRIQIFKSDSLRMKSSPPMLKSYTPSLSIDGHPGGVDNLRHDVHLARSSREGRAHTCAESPARRRNRLLAAEGPQGAPRTPFLNKLTTHEAGGKSAPDRLQIRADGPARRCDQSRKVTAKWPWICWSGCGRQVPAPGTEHEFAQFLERCRIFDAFQEHEGVRQQKALGIANAWPRSRSRRKSSAQDRAGSSFSCCASRRKPGAMRRSPFRRDGHGRPQDLISALLSEGRGATITMRRAIRHDGQTGIAIPTCDPDAQIPASSCGRWRSTSRRRRSAWDPGSILRKQRCPELVGGGTPDESTYRRPVQESPISRPGSSA